MAAEATRQQRDGNKETGRCVLSTSRLENYVLRGISGELRADACAYFIDVILKVVRGDTRAEEEEEEESGWAGARWEGGQAGGMCCVLNVLCLGTCQYVSLGQECHRPKLAWAKNVIVQSEPSGLRHMRVFFLCLQMLMQMIVESER